MVTASDPTCAAADRLWGELVRARGRCEAAHHPAVDWHHPGDCEPQGDLQAAHIVGRRCATTRHLLINGIALCKLAHDKIDGSRPAKEQLVMDLYGEVRLLALWRLRDSLERHDYPSALARLNGIAIEQGLR